MAGYGDLYDSLLGIGRKSECSRCHREFDEDSDELEAGPYGGLLCKACRTPTMMIYISEWEMEMAEEVQL